tara:strand:+ start:71 stop:643 length:573 start_codon:yes stop_codon:yes gene_type:complete
MFHTGYGFWEQWQLAHKVSFDGRARLITVPSNVTDLDIQIDLYSDWKEWARLENNLRYTRAFRSIGGDPTTDNQKAGDIYFSVNNWKIEIDLTKTRVTGVIFSDDYETPFVSHDGEPVFQSLVASLVSVVEITTETNIVTGDIGDIDVPTAEENAQALLDVDATAPQVPGTLGHFLIKKLLTVSKFIGLK